MVHTEPLEPRALLSAAVAAALPTVTGFSLIDARHDVSVPAFADLTDGTTIDLAQLPSGRVSFVANTAGPAGSVALAYDRERRVENSAPFSMFGDSRGDFTGITPKAGWHTLSARAWTRDDARGQAGPTHTVRVRFVNSAAVASFTLIDADTDQPLPGFEAVSADATVNLAALPGGAGTSVAVRANLAGAGAGVESVVFGLDGVTKYRVENEPPYALFGDRAGGADFVGRPLTVGQRSVTATPHAGDRGAGVAGAPLTVNLSIVDEPIVTTTTTVTDLSPANGEEMVGLERETIVRFSDRVDPATLDADAFYLIANGQRVGGRVVVSSTERFATFFYDDVLPAATEVRVVVDGEQVLDRGGRKLDADADGAPGGVATADFRTLPLTRIAGTNVFGYVYDSYNKDPDGSNIPVVGATIRVDAFPDASAVTDETGYFILRDMPAPEFFVHIDGTTAVNAPAGTIYPVVGKPFHSLPGQAVQLEMDGSPFHVYLPPMAAGDVVPLSQTADTDVGFGDAGKAQLQSLYPAVDPALWDVMRVTYPAGSAVDDQGNPAHAATVIPVPPDRLPAPLPPTQSPGLVISVQAIGATNFDVPAPVTFPNLKGLAPGEKSLIWSFNHDAGRWEVIGTGTVSQDGRAIVSDTGVGVLAPGWHFTEPGTLLDTIVDFINDALTDEPGDGPLPPPTQVNHNPGSGSFSTPGNSTSGATAQEAANNLEAIRRAIAASENGIAIIGGDNPAGGEGNRLGGPSAFSGFGDDAFDHVLVAYLDSSGNVRTAEMQPSGNPLGSPTQPRRSAEEVARSYDRVTGVAVNDLTPEQRQAFIANIERTTQPGETYSFDRDKGETCATAINDALNGAGVPTDLTSSRGRFNSLRPGTVIEHFQNRNRLHTPNNLRLNGSDSLTLNSSHQDFSRRVYYRIDFTQGASSIQTLVGRTNDGGELSAVLPPNATGYIALYEPIGKSATTQLFDTRDSGSAVELIPQLNVNFSFAAADGDGDGIPDIGEDVIGTLSAVADSDGDGINDGAEIDQGLDPLNGRAFPSGIISALPLLGPARAVVVEDGTAYVATGGYGLAVVDARQFRNPIVLGQLDLPGDATGVAADPALGLVAVASNAGGLHVVDVADPMLPVLRQTVNLNTNLVEVVDGVAYAAVGATLQAIDLVTGQNLQTLQLPGGGFVSGLAKEGTRLFAFVSGGDRFCVVDAARRGQAGVTGSLFVSVASTDVGVAVGNGVAYLAGSGLRTIDVTDPAAPTLIGDADLFFTARNVALNGSGLALIASEDQGVGVYDVTDPQDTNNLLTRFDTPGFARSLAVASGIAFVADETGGLLAVNYLPFDNRGTAPAVSIGSPVTDQDPAAPGVQVVEGTSIPIAVTVADDVQVRNVELLVNGQVVRNDVSFPFEFSAVALNPSGGPVTVQARATDTGGNAALSQVLTFELVPDTFAPTITGTTPVAGAVKPEGMRTVSVRFSEPVVITGDTTSVFQLVEAGPNGTRGDADDTVVPVVNFQVRENDTLVQLTTAGLPVGAYRFRVARDAVADRAGNALGAGEFTTDFTVVPFTVSPDFLPFGTVELAFGDDQSASIGPMPFSFDFFGQQVTDDVFISSNGVIEFGQDIGSSFSNTNLPFGSARAILPFWDDIDPRFGGARIGVYDGENVRAVTWESVPYYGRGSSPTVTFQAALYANGTIVFRYATMGGPPNGTATIGLTNMGLTAVVPALGAIANRPDLTITDAGGQIGDVSPLDEIEDRNGVLVFTPDGQGSYTVTLNP